MNASLLSSFVLVVGVGSLLLAAGCPKQSAAKQGPRSEGGPAVPVTTAAVVQRATAVTVPSFGTVEACADVEVKAQVTGILVQVHLTEGQMVKKGDLLLSIDPRQPQANLKMARANLERDQAQLKNAEREAARQTELLQKGYASQEIYDQAMTAVETLRAAVSADQAAIENAALQLDYCSIRSPVDGCAGRLEVHQGNLVKANDVSVVTIRQIDPIYVSFWVREQHLPAIQKHRATRALDVGVTPPGAGGAPAHGVLSFVDNTVDPANRTIHLRATFENKDRRLWPGQYVNVVLTVAQEADSIVVPLPAIQPGQDQQFIYVVKSDQTVEARPVTVKRALDDKESVVEGVRPGEVVVTDGHLRLVPGARVQIKGGDATGGPARTAARPAPEGPSAPPASKPTGKDEVTNP
ncbi:MAG: efflux RND transporter periplasmic adaptor subunit [Planctomycetes bacterium]|jgi:multidrug efflux system membrane fusion protein|nr:efflux RND transporter periplasmic adaptor subunit [Planctomycetota bacterium]